MTNEPPADAPLWQPAVSFAARAHRHQFRRDERTPYVAHPVRVALTLACVFGCTDQTVLAAALLHDVIEDTTVDYDELLEAFGKEVADVVACLSKDMRMVEPERERRYDECLAGGPWEARLIKLADVYDNLSDARDAAGWRTISEKARRALKLAEGAKDADKLARAREIVRDLLERVERGLR
jgi:guanosine-3',5'-bis(diphosphate) 3'-pyrophosphohydrolase